MTKQVKSTKKFGDEHLIEGFKKVCTGNISDVLEAMGYRSAVHQEIRPIFVPIIMVGRAHTIKVEKMKREGDPSGVSTIAKETCKPGDVVVLACGGYQHGDAVIWGENSATACQVRGAVGTIIDGGCRDTARLREMNFPVYCRATSPGGRRGTLYTVAYDVPVVFGGIRVSPGDIIVGDDDGICVIPKEIAEEALRRVEAYAKLDQAVAPALREGKSVAEAYSIKAGALKY